MTASVIIPCYGGADASGAIASAPEGCEVIVSGEGKTPGETRENGMKKAHGEWVTFLDADDVFTADFLQELRSLPEKAAQAIFRVWDEGSGCLRPADNVFLHGKFYRRDWWEAHEIHFPKVLTNEDAGIYVAVNGILYTEDKARERTVVVEKRVYDYRANPRSMTRSNPDYDRDGIPDFLEAVCGTLLKRPDIDTAWRQRQIKKAIAICRTADDGRHEKIIAETERRANECLRS